MYAKSVSCPAYQDFDQCNSQLKKELGHRIHSEFSCLEFGAYFSLRNTVNANSQHYIKTNLQNWWNHIYSFTVKPQLLIRCFLLTLSPRCTSKWVLKLILGWGRGSTWGCHEKTISNCMCEIRESRLKVWPRVQQKPRGLNGWLCEGIQDRRGGPKGQSPA